jgi:hypothetical protein
MFTFPMKARWPARFTTSAKICRDDCVQRGVNDGNDGASWLWYAYLRRFQVNGREIRAQGGSVLEVPPYRLFVRVLREISVEEAGLGRERVLLEPAYIHEFTKQAPVSNNHAPASGKNKAAGQAYHCNRGKSMPVPEKMYWGAWQ